MPELDFMGSLGLNQLNFGMGTMGNIVLAIAIGLIAIILIGGFTFWLVRRKTYIFKIKVFRVVGNEPKVVGNFRAKAINIGRAGDKLWFVAGVKKYLTPATIQSGPLEYWYWIRKDGEWFNFGLTDLDESQQLVDAKFIAQDMRMQRLAIDRLLEQRLLQKSFMEKWGTAIGLVLYFLLTSVALAIVFYMFADIASNLATVSGNLAKTSVEQNGGGGGQLIPATIGGLIFTKRFRRKQQNV